ncbi:MAG: acyl carrier protein [Cyanobacteriota bacterium]|nr:acyl carrier protein [Cyanobacteriota bacterium]
MTPISTDQLLALIATVTGPIQPPLHADSPLVGHGSAVSSMTLVQICLQLEDEAIARGGSFDWTSERAMSQLAGMFRSVAALAGEFNRQLGA